MRAIFNSFNCLFLLSLTALLFASAAPARADACSYGLVAMPGENGIQVGRVGPCPEFMFTVPPPGPNMPCTLKRIESYPMQPDGEGHAVIPFVIDKPRMMIVDTGGARSTIYSSLVKELNLKSFNARDVHFPESAEVAFGGYVLTDIAVIPTLTYGVLKFNGAHFFVEEDTRKPPLAANEILGSLGPSHLMTFDLEFDFAKSRFNLYLQHHCPGHAVYWASAYATLPFELSAEGHILLKAVLDGKEVTATLDSGAPFSTLDRFAASRLLHVGLAHEGIPESYHFQSLTIGGVEIRNPDLVITPDLMSVEAAKDAPEMIIGLREMSALHMFIAYSEQVLYVTTVDAH